MDNTNYYSVLMDRLHNRSTHREKIICWLQKHGVEYDHLENIPELMKQVELYTTHESCSNWTT
jgi:hypothetical protein